jgi:multiple antibiotic resistance protein
MIIDFALVLQIFVLLNPLSSMPFLMTAHQHGANVKVIAVKAVIVAFLLGVVMVIAGPWLFGIFGITLDSFRLAGGTILFLLGIRMVTPKPEEERTIDSIDSFITIMATPLLTGPATISFLTIKAFEVGKTTVLVNLCAAFVLVAAVFILFSFLIDRVNVKLIDIVSRVLGLFLTAVAIELLAKGLEGLIQGAIAHRAQQGM